MKSNVLSLLAVAPILAVAGVASASATAILYSGTFEGGHPAPVSIGKVNRGEEVQIDFIRATALVNYPGRDNSVITERVRTYESGAVVSCPWYLKLDGSPSGLKVNDPVSQRFDRKVVCDGDECTDLSGRPKGPSTLLFGKYDLPKCKRGDVDLGFYTEIWKQTPADGCSGPYCGPKLDSVKACCPEFTVERLFSEEHLFDRLLVVEDFREDELLDLDVDYRRIYFSFENERGERATCTFTDLSPNGGLSIHVDNLRDCVLPPGDQFTMYAESRFFLKETRPCGKFVTRGRRQSDGTYNPDWFMGWYECDGKADRTPIEKQFTYATRVELRFTPSRIEGSLL